MLKTFILVRMTHQWAKQECLMEHKAKLKAEAVTYFGQCYPHIALDEDGYAKVGNETWCVAEQYEPIQWPYPATRA